MSIQRHQIAAATEALRDVLKFDQPADAVLSRFLREHREFGQTDRAFVAESVFGVLRTKRLLDHLVDAPTPRRLLLAHLARGMGASVRELAPLLRRGEADWLASVKAAATEALPLGVAAELPDWVVERLQGQFDDAEILALGRALQQPAPLDVRVNTLRTDRESVLRELAADGIACTPTPWSPVGVRIKGRPALNRHPLFVNGAIEVQDEGSQLLAVLVAPRRSDLVVDFCAGAGGKSLQLGAMMQSHGRIYAYDVSDTRLARLKPRLKRSGLSNLHPQRIQNENDVRIKRLAGKADRVLVDAPCSGLGTLRRNPDLKWRQSPQDVAELVVKQSSILRAASRLLKSGGRLVYATCSLLTEENQQVVEAFLAERPEFRLLDCADILRQQRIALDTGPYLQLRPHLHATDGFFAAAMEKTQ